MYSIVQLLITYTLNTYYYLRMSHTETIIYSKLYEYNKNFIYIHLPLKQAGNKMLRFPQR